MRMGQNGPNGVLVGIDLDGIEKRFRPLSQNTAYARSILKEVLKKSLGPRFTWFTGRVHMTQDQ